MDSLSANVADCLQELWKEVGCLTYEREEDEKTYSKTHFVIHYVSAGVVP